MWREREREWEEVAKLLNISRSCEAYCRVLELGKIKIFFE